MEMEFTPRFNKIGESEKNLFIKEKRKKERHASKKLSNIKKLKHKCNKKGKKKHKRNQSNINININTFLNQKFILRNDFDKEHSKMFLKEKYECMEEPILLDEICI